MTANLDFFLALLKVQLLQVSLLIVIVGLIACLLRNRHPHLVFALWAVVFVKCLTPPLMVTPLGLFAWQAPRIPAPAESVRFAPRIGQYDDVPRWPASEGGIAATCDGQSVIGSPRGDGPGNLAGGETGDGPEFSSSPPGQPVLSMITGRVPRVFESITRAMNSSLGLFGLWLTGVWALLSMVSVQWIRCWLAIRHNRLPVSPQLESIVQRVRQRLQFRPEVRVIVTSSGYGPLVFGYFRPVLVLPNQIVDHPLPRQLEPVIAHELIHVRRGDTLLSLLQFLAQTILWFNPLVWWASRQTNRICERCCDLEVVNSLRCPPLEYARTLLGILELRYSLRGLAAAAGIRPTDITARRLGWLVKRRRDVPRPWHSWLVATIAAVLVYPAAGMHRPRDETLASAPHVGTKSLSGQADAAFDRQDWKTAARLYRRCIDANQDNGPAWFRLGYALHILGELDQALVAHQRASEFPQSRRLALYNWACALNLRGDPEAALAKLGEALDAGLVLRRPMEDDPDLATLKPNERFQALVRRHGEMALRQAASPGDHPQIRLGVTLAEDGERPARPGRRPGHVPPRVPLDFWLGTWNIVDRAGQSVATSVVTRQQGGRMIFQKWSGSNGTSGQSINYQDPASDCWIHHGVDSDDTVFKLAGNVNENHTLQWSGTAVFRNGQTASCNMSLKRLGDGRLHHQILISSDNGETWETVMEGFYQRSTEPSR